MNKLEKGLVVVGLLGGLTFAGFGISDMVKMSNKKLTSKYTWPIGLISTACLVSGVARTGYKKIKGKTPQTELKVKSSDETELEEITFEEAKKLVADGKAKFKPYKDDMIFALSHEKKLYWRSDIKEAYCR